MSRKLKKLRCKCKDFYYDCKQFFRNVRHFLKQAWKWRSWDSSYSIDSFADNLQYLGEQIKKYNGASNKAYVRCYIAAHLLRTAYNDSIRYQDKSYSNWTRNNRITFVRIQEGQYKGMSQLGYERKYPEDYSEKMQKVIDKRIDKIEADRKLEAWAFIHKWAPSLWD